MIKVIRIDYRLIHGQVAVSWVRKTGVDYLVVSDDKASDDPLVKMTMKLAQPSDVGMDILPTEKVIALTKKGRYVRKKVMMICGNIKEAADLIEALHEEENITAVVVGNIKAKEGSLHYNNAVDMTLCELEDALRITKCGVKVNLQLFPDSDPETLSEERLIKDINLYKEER